MGPTERYSSGRALRTHGIGAEAEVLSYVGSTPGSQAEVPWGSDGGCEGAVMIGAGGGNLTTDLMENDG